MIVKILEQTVLTLIYPFWFFFCKTLVGNIIIVPCVLVSPILISMLFISDKGSSGESAKDLGLVLAILNFILLIPIGFVLMKLMDYIEQKYIDFGYKTEMKFKI